jgi:hypothetical protein
VWQERGYNGDSLWVWGVAAPYGDSIMIEEFIDSTGVTYPLIATTSVFGFSIAILKTFLPIRPKPLIANFTVISCLLFVF